MENFVERGYANDRLQEGAAARRDSDAALRTQLEHKIQLLESQVAIVQLNINCRNPGC